MCEPRDAIRTLTEERRIQIELEDLFLREFLLDAIGEDHLLVLRDDPADEPSVQSGSLENVERPRHLLRDRAAADRRTTPRDLADRRANHAAPVDAGVLEEVLVLGRQDGFDQ